MGGPHPAELVTRDAAPGPVRYRCAVTVWETVLVFAVLPLGGLLLLALLVVGPGVARAPRYRVGRSWDHDPVWYVARPDVAAPAGSAEGRAAIAAATGRALPYAEPERSASTQTEVTGSAGPAGSAGFAGAAPASVLDAPRGTARGGASGEW